MSITEPVISALISRLRVSKGSNVDAIGVIRFYMPPEGEGPPVTGVRPFPMIPPPPISLDVSICIYGISIGCPPFIS